MENLKKIKFGNSVFEIKAGKNIEISEDNTINSTLEYTSGNEIRVFSDNSINWTGNVKPASKTKLGGLRAWIDEDNYLCFSTEKSYDKDEILANADFLTIAEICDAGLESQVFEIGDSTKFKLATGEEIELEIIGFRHDDLADGSGKAAITWECKFTLDTTYRMNTAETNKGGWADCEMRNDTLSSIYELLPNDLKYAIKIVNKTTSAGQKSEDLITTQDKLFLLSLVEVFGTDLQTSDGTQYDTEYAASGEGTQYAFYRNAPVPSPEYSGTFKKLQGDTGTFWSTRIQNITSKFGEQLRVYHDAFCNYNVVKNYEEIEIHRRTWWLRSPNVSMNTHFCTATYEISRSRSSANETWGLAFALCT